MRIFFQKVVENFRVPEVDLFATRLNRKVECFVSWSPDPDAYMIDAYTIVWTDFYFYAFPPFSCVSRVIAKALEEEARGILIFPWWPTQPSGGDWWH